MSGQQNTSKISLKKSVAVGAGAGFLGSTAFLAVMFLFPVNPFSIMANTLTGSTGPVGVKVQPLGWLIHTSLTTLWAAVFGFAASKLNLRRIYLGGVAWALLAWLWTLGIIAVYRLLSPAVAFIELSVYLVYALVLASGYSYGVWGTIEAKVSGESY